MEVYHSPHVVFPVILRTVQQILLTGSDLLREPVGPFSQKFFELYILLKSKIYAETVKTVLTILRHPSRNRYRYHTHFR